MRRDLFKSVLVIASLIALSLNWLAPVAVGQSNGKSLSLRGYSDAHAREQIRWEEKMRAVPDPERLREYMKYMSAEPHYVGSTYNRKNAEYMLNKFRSWGLKAEIEEFEVLFPTPKERVLEMVAPERFRAQLKEPAIPEDPDSGDADQLPTYNAYSADGDVTGELVYVNYGMPADYDELTKLGIDVKGKIVIARYGGGWRGIKPKVAHEHGAIGCIIYSDPRDDGYYQGDVYPEGAYRPSHGVQRGSVKEITPGDPLTPGWGSTKGARRIRREEADVIMKVPVLPISYGDALPMLKAIRGPVAPESWRGALPITYHIGPGPTKVHLKLAFDWSIRPLYNVIVRIEGSAYPDEWIIYGNHHDAWVNGAMDPVSGMVTVMEVARGFADLLRQGWRPKRTIILCAWDGEEPGLLGSTEWVEAHADELKEKAVVYLNSDSNGKGWLGASGSHTLERLVNEVMRDVQNPTMDKSLWDALDERRRARAGGEQARPATQERADHRIGALGSGSDYTAFLDFLGIASLDTGFGGDGGGGVYHSIYDSFTWYTKFADTTFEFGRALAQYNGTLVMRMAAADVLPFDFLGLADTVNRYIAEIEQLAKSGASPTAIDFAPLKSAAAAVAESARRYDEAMRRASAQGGQSLEAMKQVRELNKLLYQSERRLVSEQGLPRRAWFKHLIYAPGAYTGYAVKTIPGVREAIEQKNWSDVEPQMKNVSAALRALAAQVDAATRLLDGAMSQ
jgi:N-acetylated-alpha-linked acidic dipeptidase